MLAALAGCASASAPCAARSWQVRPCWRIRLLRPRAMLVLSDKLASSSRSPLCSEQETPPHQSNSTKHVAHVRKSSHHRNRPYYTPAAGALLARVEDARDACLASALLPPCRTEAAVQKLGMPQSCRLCQLQPSFAQAHAHASSHSPPSLALALALALTRMPISYGLLQMRKHDS